ncbi:putative cyclophilin type peptidyl-prolyl cis-trans isomerase [Trypanosoma rangeli]|uniref:peptidylprolyl isomerase n=1 Tax=Trypanosoma rangeli TaxID=5698 RepID=A0A3R7RS09_TRYRA|nr:putative cyclophilin type peptidyl-prolyl cis-trans isomerase [Trypanosoma rangeli]RNF11693.1 putative cyclophilin type peptidyl-prolyl cis-trans isomerase [Trypanosoma rangeli]|eukprot:RNF11693.1 putative cyclophilin type peptidyl-prolyl cis-trans isomerase [Trypanosoma rangeli]
MSQRGNSDGGVRASRGMEEDDDEEEDFLPAIPEVLLHQQQNGPTTTTSDQSLGVGRGKRSRSSSMDKVDDVDNGASRDAGCNAGEDKQGEECFVELLSSEGFPSSSLYERSYQHSHFLQDIGVVQDELGSLIATVDSTGTLRAWRKLPRGVFFMGDRQGLFPQKVREGDLNDVVKHFILTDPLTPSLLVVRIMPCVEATAGVVTVAVEVRVVSSTLMTVDARLSCEFSVTLNMKSKSPCWKESVTQRPFLLHHDHQPFIVFFTMEKDGTSHTVFLPCVTEKSPRSGGTATIVASTPLSTANLVVCCQQHRPSGLVVLVDEKGIIDYARIMVSPGNEGQSVAYLQVVSGVPSRGTSDPMILRRWITFDRRQKTGFFTLLRDAMGAAKTGRVMLPLQVGFSATGKYFVVSSGVLREGHVCVFAHVFDFSSGQLLCRGETDETATPSLVGENALREALWLLRGAVFDVVVEDAVHKSPQGGAGGVWVFVPEIMLETPVEGRVCGRRVFVFCAAPLPANRTMLSGASGASTCALVTPFHMEQLWRPIGDLEKTLRELLSPTSSVLASGAALDRHFAAPLTLIRLTVPASQALKNLVGQSPVGSTLLQEDVKRLFVVPSNTALAASSNERLFNAADPMFFTASPGEYALLLYTKYEVQFGVSNALRAENIAPTNATDDDAGKTEQKYREKALCDLHQKRDFDCEDLLVLRSSLQGVMPREVVTDNNDENQKPESMTPEKSDEHELDGDVEERRVQHIIATATGHSIEWGTSTVHVTLFIDHFGTVTVRLLPQFAPKAVKNFVTLAQEGFYNGLTFHRVVPGFMIQGGCPAGDGSGGKSIFGGRFEDEGVHVMDFFSYPTVYWLCMANCGPNTNESQFFITVGEAAPWLNGKHTVFGFVATGKPVVRAVVQTSRGEDDKPISPVVIRHAIVTERATNE